MFDSHVHAHPFDCSLISIYRMRSFASSMWHQSLVSQDAREFAVVKLDLLFQRRPNSKCEMRSDNVCRRLHEFVKWEKVFELIKDFFLRKLCVKFWTLFTWYKIHHHHIINLRIEPGNTNLKRWEHSSSSFRDNHFCSLLMEFVP